MHPEENSIKSTLSSFESLPKERKEMEVQADHDL